ncbi:Ulp1 protease-like protein 2 [Elsinoe fawcettii]|nr:Ulp1 protease-like protein 2 [Elsinoe fawcettii]
MWGTARFITAALTTTFSQLSRATSTGRRAIALRLNLIREQFESRQTASLPTLTPYINTVPTGSKRARTLHSLDESPRATKRQSLSPSPTADHDDDAASDASSVLSFDTVSTFIWGGQSDGFGLYRSKNRLYPPPQRKRSPARDHVELERRNSRRRKKERLRRKRAGLPLDPCCVPCRSMEVRKLQEAIAEDFGFGRDWVEQDERAEEERRKNEIEEERIDEAIKARKEGREELRRSLIEEKQERMDAQLQEKRRLRKLKAAKKRKLVALWREGQKIQDEKDFFKAKEEYDKEFEVIGDGLNQISLDDTGFGGRRVDRYGKILPTPKKVEKKKFIGNLSSDWDEKVTAALAHRSDAKIIAKTLEGVDISRRDIGTVIDVRSPDRMPWLNDEIVNGFYANLCARANEQAGYVKGPNNVPRFAAYSSAWLTSASSRGVNSIQGWSRRKGIKGEKLLKCERIFLPCNNGVHWTLLAISGTKRTIEYLDSMDRKGWTNKKMVNLAFAWLKMELGNKFKEDEWKVLEVKTSIQNNSDDCGVFTCFNGWALAKGHDDPSAEFGPGDMKLARRVLVAVILNGGFTGDFDL